MRPEPLRAAIGISRRAFLRKGARAAGATARALRHRARPRRRPRPAPPPRPDGCTIV